MKHTNVKPHSSISHSETLPSDSLVSNDGKTGSLSSFPGGSSSYGPESATVFNADYREGPRIDNVARTSSDSPVPVPLPRWVISDTHLGHASILSYCPWRQSWANTIEQHDAMILASWRKVVQPDDWVLHLGDFALGPKDQLVELRRMLPGRIILVRGNHDRSLAIMRAAGFDHVHAAAIIEEDGQCWVARHNPAAFSLREAAHSVRLLHGHSHGAMDMRRLFTNQSSRKRWIARSMR